MGRAYVGAALVILITAMLIQSASSGFINSISYMSWRQKLLSLFGLFLVVMAIWSYWHGDVQYLVWLKNAPPRPADEIAFVEHVQNLHELWSAEQDPANKATLCQRETGELAHIASPVVDWTGTVSSAYGIGTRIMLVVRIGRLLQLRTSYNDEQGGSFIEPNSPNFERAALLKSGDSVILSGEFVPYSKGCVFSNGGDDGSETLLLFQFTKLAIVEG